MPDGTLWFIMSEADQFYPASATSRMPHEKALCPMTVIKKPGMALAKLSNEGQSKT